MRVNLFSTTDQYDKCGALITLLAILCFPIILSSSSGHATNEVYNSGYDHECDDAGILDPADRYQSTREGTIFSQ
jgi:hypothetical protein